MAAGSVCLRSGVCYQFLGCFRNYTKNIRQDTKNLCRSLCSGATETSNTSRDAVSDAVEDVPVKRKEFRKFRSRVYRQNRLNPELERSARQGNYRGKTRTHGDNTVSFNVVHHGNIVALVVINLETVHQEWLAKEGLQTIYQLAKHYGIFEHIFRGLDFKPSVMMKIKYEQDNKEVKWGNFITPAQATSCPSVDFESDSDTHWTLILTNPDGNIWDKDNELLHWFVANIPGRKVSEGEVVREYVPPIPPKNTGFHRYVFCLLRQRNKLNLDKYTALDSSFYSQRTFQMAELLSGHNDDFTPVGLSFFQAAWDETVTNTFSKTLGMTEPVYDLKPFITPTYKRKNTTAVTFDNKYRNM